LGKNFRKPQGGLTHTVDIASDRNNIFVKFQQLTYVFRDLASWIGRPTQIDNVHRKQQNGACKPKIEIATATPS